MIVIIAGPGGVGKGTVVDRLLRLDPDLKLSRSWTTRPRRSGEADDAYVFTERPAFEERIRNQGFLEWTEFSGTGHLYGTPTLDDPSATVLLEIELDGAQQVRAQHPDALLILIVAPSRAEQEERLRRRGDDEQSVKRRLAVGSEEQRLGEQIADYVVVNDDADRAAEDVAGILRRHRSNPPTTEP